MTRKIKGGLCPVAQAAREDEEDFDSAVVDVVPRPTVGGAKKRKSKKASKKASKKKSKGGAKKKRSTKKASKKASKKRSSRKK